MEEIRGRRVIVVGAGVAGLACALQLRRLGLLPTLFEASDRPGGRVRTDAVDGFRLDRGFQVLPDAYPEVKRLLDLDALGAGAMRPGALVRWRGGFERVIDPVRAPSCALSAMSSRIGSFTDKLRLLRLRRRLLATPLEQIRTYPERSALDELRADGFSTAIIERFFRPFLGGVFLERELETSNRLMYFALRSFIAGRARLPRGGMEAVPRALAARLPRGSIRTRTPVRAVASDGVVLDDGRREPAAAVVVASEAAAAARLVPGLDVAEANGSACLYFDAPRPPVEEPILLLDGEGRGPVNNLCVPSQVAAGYAQPGRALVSASIVGRPLLDDATLERGVRAQLGDWFGEQVASWRLLRVYRISEALPVCIPPAAGPGLLPLRIGERLFVCGDHRGLPTLDDALASGRRAAEGVRAVLSP